MSSAGTLYYALGKADTGGTNHVPEITTTRKLMEGEDPTASWGFRTRFGCSGVSVG